MADDNVEDRIDNLEDKVENLEERMDRLIEISKEQKAREVENNQRKRRESTDDSRNRDTISSKIEETSKVKILGVVGSLAVFLAVVFSIQYAIQNDLISYLQRVLIGMGLGVALASSGYYMARRGKNELYGWILTGVGIAVTYFSLYASYAFPEYRENIGVSFGVVIIGIAIIVALSVALSIKEDQRVLASESVLLGFISTYFTLDGFSELPALVYTTILSIGVVVILTNKDWKELAAVGSLSSFTLAGIVVFSEELSFGLTISFLTVLFLLYGVSAILGTDNARISNLVSIKIGFFYGGLFSFATLAYENSYEQYSLIGWLVASAFFALAVVMDRKELEVPKISDINVPGSFIYLTFILALIGSAEYDLYYSSFVGIALVTVSVYLSSLHDGDRMLSILLTAITATKVLIFDWIVEGPVEDGLLEVSATYSVTLFVVSMFAISYYVTYKDMRMRGRKLGRLYVTVASLGLFFLPIIQFEGSIVSVFWALVAVAYVGSGIASDKKIIRTQGLSIFAATVIKVFVFDLQGLSVINRVLSLTVLGVGLLISSYIYSNYLTDEEE